MIIIRSVEKDHWPVGWILTTLNWISPGIGPRVAADRGWYYLCLHLICTRERPCASGERWDVVSTTTWLLQKAKSFKSTKKERGKKTGTHLCFLHSAMPTHVVQDRQGHAEYTDDLGTLPGAFTQLVWAVVQSANDFCGLELRGHLTWMGTPSRAALPSLAQPAAQGQEQNGHRGRTRGKVCRFHSYLSPEGSLHLGSNCSFSGTTSFSMR